VHVYQCQKVFLAKLKLTLYVPSMHFQTIYFLNTMNIVKCCILTIAIFIGCWFDETLLGTMTTRTTTTMVMMMVFNYMYA